VFQGELCETWNQAGVGRRSTIVARPGPRNAPVPEADRGHRPTSRLALWSLTLLAAAVYSVLGLYWSSKAVVDAAAGLYGTDFYFGMILGAAFIVLAVIQWVAWSRTRRSSR